MKADTEKINKSKPYEIALRLVFVIISFLTAFNPGLIHFWLKPLLMPVLLIILLFSGHLIHFKNFIVCALLFSWVGDVLLLFEENKPLFFIAGLSAFLLAHVMYILYFLKLPASGKSLLRTQPWLAALVAGYGMSLLNILWPGLGEMKIPVALYAAVICTMIICSLHAFNRVNSPSNRLLVTGALLFALSDSLLAIHKFLKPFPYAGAAIMLSYCAAQFCIVSGVIRVRLSIPAAGGGS